jgi:hypothetical protein
MRPQPPWEEKDGVLVLRLYKTDQHGDWDEDVNKGDLHPDFPRVVVLDVDEGKFLEFDRDPWAFAQKHELFPEQNILWMSSCQKPPTGKEIPRLTDRWTVVIVHTKNSGAACAAAPQ